MFEAATATDETLAAAQAGDKDAAAQIMADMDSRLASLGRRAASQAFPDDAGRRLDETQDFTQEARLVAWERLIDYTGGSLDAFFAYAYATADKELIAKSRDLRYGTNDDPDGKKLFATMVKYIRETDVQHRLTESDYLTLAEQSVQDKALLATWKEGVYGARRLSAERASAARLAYQGSISIYQESGNSDAYDGDSCLADTLVADDDVEAAALGRGSIALTVQQDRQSLVMEGVIRRALVRRVVASMGHSQAYILAATFGFAGMGTFKDDKAIARAMVAAGFEDVDATKVVRNRNKALAAFAKKYAAIVAKSGDEHAALLALAAKQGVDPFADED